MDSLSPSQWSFPSAMESTASSFPRSFAPKLGKGVVIHCSSGRSSCYTPTSNAIESESSRRMTARDVRILAIAFVVVLLAAGCATPIGVSPGRHQAVYRALTASVLSNGKLSPPTEQMLLRRALSQRFEEDPEGVLSELRGSGKDLTEDDHAALAELCFFYAEKSGKQDYYL